MMFLIGMSLNTIYGSNMLHELRIFGVLQRLAVAYLISAGFYALTAPKYYTPPRVSSTLVFKDSYENSIVSKVFFVDGRFYTVDNVE